MTHIEPAVSLTESVSRFGAGEHLVGVLTRLSEAVDVARAPNGRTSSVGILLLNAGVVSRMGPHRFNVKLARCLARRGLPVLRFDLSGQGDSGAAPGELQRTQRVTRDIVEAIDAMQCDAGVDCVVIVGICSGANQAWTAALEDPRIAGLVMVDPFAYPTYKTMPMYHWRRIKHRSRTEIMSTAVAAISGLPSSAAASIRSRLSGIGAALRAAKFRTDAVRLADLDSNDDDGDKLSVSAYAAGMQTLVDRGVEMLLVFTGTWSRYYSYREQFRDVFGRYAFVDKVGCEFVPQYDHTFTLVGAQQRMIRHVEAWLLARVAMFAANGLAASRPSAAAPLGDVAPLSDVAPHAAVAALSTMSAPCAAPSLELVEGAPRQQPADQRSPVEH